MLEENRVMLSQIYQGKNMIFKPRIVFPAKLSTEDESKRNTFSHT